MSIVVLIGVALVAGGGWVWQWHHESQSLARVDAMLDDLLENKDVCENALKEDAVSALAHKMQQIQRLRACDVALAEQEKESIKALVNNLSHQLKTPLANVLLYQELMTDETLTSAQRKSFLNKQRQQLDKMDWVMQSLLKMVQLEQDVIAFEAAPLSLEETVREAVNAVYGKALAKQIEITVVPFEDCLLWHHKKWTAEVFVNLLENAIKYTPQGGHVTISVRSMELYTEIRFIDDGMGVKESEQTEIFKRFYRSSDAEGQEGTGIGLYLTRLILEKEKGMVTVQANPEGGSCFSVFLQNCHKKDADLKED